MPEAVLVWCLKQRLVLWQRLPGSSSEVNVGIVSVEAVPGKERVELCAAGAPSKFHHQETSVSRTVNSLLGDSPSLQ